MSALRTAFKLLLLAAATVLVVLLLRHWMATKQYVFSREDVAKLAKQYAGELGSVGGVCADLAQGGRGPGSGSAGGHSRSALRD